MFGEKACAVVEPVPGKSIDFETMNEFLKSLGLSKEKLPERLELRAALPLSPDGKILKAKVRQEIGTDPAIALQ
jgi:cyclohexanecarboxylate-CoA ligase